MEDFFRFFRQSKIRVKVKQQQQHPNNNQSSQSKERLTNSNESLNKRIPLQKDSPKFSINNRCIHISQEKWTEIWINSIERKCSYLQGLVFINPNFARSYYIPSCSFRYGFDSFNEYSQVDLELLAQMRNDQYDRWMKTFIQSDSCHVSMHCCQVVEILDRYCVRCPNLTRISFHFYYLDRRVIEYMNRFLPQLVSINFENSIGLSEKAFYKFGLMKNLLHLNLSGCELYENGLHALLESCPFLETLNLSNNCSISGHCLSHETVKNLKRLNIQDCWRITSERLMEMAQNGLPNLIELLCNSGINDQSLRAICLNSPNLIHLDISFEEFTYFDRSGMDCLTDFGFSTIANLTNLKILVLRHVGRLTDKALNRIFLSCTNLLKIILNLRHRHKLTDQGALLNLPTSCNQLKYFEAVHNHFIAKNSILQLSLLVSSLKELNLRGDELIKDGDISILIDKCLNLRSISLDGCKFIGEETLAKSVIHAKKLARWTDQDGSKPIFRASLVLTRIDRTYIDSLVEQFPENLRIRASHYHDNVSHYNEFDGVRVHVYNLKDRFYPLYWCDFN